MPSKYSHWISNLTTEEKRAELLAAIERAAGDMDAVFVDLEMTRSTTEAWLRRLGLQNVPAEVRARAKARFLLSPIRPMTDLERYNDLTSEFELSKYANELGIEVAIKPEVASAKILNLFKKEEVGANRALLANEIGIDRITLWRWIRKLGIADQIKTIEERARVEGWRKDERVAGGRGPTKRARSTVGI